MAWNTASERIAELQTPIPVFQGSAGATSAFDTFIAAVELGTFGAIPLSSTGAGVIRRPHGVPPLGRRLGLG